MIQHADKVASINCCFTGAPLHCQLLAIIETYKRDLVFGTSDLATHFALLTYTAHTTTLGHMLNCCSRSQ